MTIVTKGGHGAGSAPLDPGASGRQNSVAHGKQKGMSAFTAFDFSEQALLGRDASAKEGEKEHARRGPSHDVADGPDKKSDDSTGGLLAIAFGAQAPEAPTALAAGAQVTIDVSGASRTDAIMDRIEQAVRASMQTGSLTPVSLTIRLDDLQLPGLQSLQIAMTKDQLDVTFARAAGPVDPALIVAAQGLAQQLAVKYPTRVVRVLDMDPDRDGEGRDLRRTSGLRAISDLLANRMGGA